MARAPLIVVTSIPRRVMTSLGSEMPNATAHQRFGELIAAIGAVPVVSDAWAEPEALADHVDGVVINGGTDVAPERYGAVRLPTTDPPDARRDAFELGLARAAIAREIPVLGVCRGMQLLNVALGGTLVQELSTRTDVDHYVRDPCDRAVHEVALAPGSLVARAYGRTRLGVNTVHHEAVDRLGAGLRVTARADDGTVEAIEHERGRVVGVQWHPEFMGGAAADEQVALFRAFFGELLGCAGAENSQPGGGEFGTATAADGPDRT